LIKNLKNIIMTTSLEKLKSAGSRHAFPGVIFNVILPGAITNENLFIAEIESLAGGEPPRHVHTLEDEIVIIKEGTITYFIGDDIISASAGDTVVLPKNVPHNFVITSSKMRIILIATSASFGEFFHGLSTQYNDTNIPPVQRPSEAKRKEVEALMDNFGMYYV
jgi:quercetin dioxygenase-like cupin family protein